MKKCVYDKSNENNLLNIVIKNKFSTFNNTNSKSSFSKTSVNNSSLSSTNKEKLIQRLSDILNIRLSIDNIIIDSFELRNIINKNLDLIDMKHMEVNSMNTFVDDLIEIIKENKNIEADKTINYKNENYRPRATSEEKFARRRTIELALEKPKGVSKGPLRFNLFDKDKYKREEKIFHRDAEESTTLEQMKIKMIKEVVDEVEGNINKSISKR